MIVYNHGKCNTKGEHMAEKDILPKVPEDGNNGESTSGVRPEVQAAAEAAELLQPEQITADEIATRDKEDADNIESLRGHLRTGVDSSLHIPEPAERREKKAPGRFGPR
jgi:hypothetical protein